MVDLYWDKKMQHSDKDKKHKHSVSVSVRKVGRNNLPINNHDILFEETKILSYCLRLTTRLLRSTNVGITTIIMKKT